MSEKPPIYRDENGKPLNQPKSPAQKTAEEFTAKINNFHWRADYLKFCEVLELTPDSYAEEKYSQFQELINYLNHFDVETLSKMIDDGK